MNFKKILSLVLSVMMILTSVSVIATEEIKTPDALVTAELTDLDVTAVPACDTSITEDITLDFGMMFATTDEYEDVKDEPYINYVTDFKLSFSDDVTALLAGQYTAWSDLWVSVRADEYIPEAIGGLDMDVDGISFKGGEENAIYVMKDSGLDPQFTYEEVVSIKEFNCGVKFAYDTPSGVTAKLSLVMFPVSVVEHEGNHYDDEICDFVKDGVCYKIERENEIILDTVEYTYNKNALGINTETTDEKKAEIIEEKLEEIVESKEAAKGALDIIGTLDQEVKDEIAPETVKALIEASGVTVNDVTVPTVFESKANGTISVTITDATTPAEEFEDYEDVYEVTAECSVEGPKTTVPAPVLVAIPVDDSSLVYAVKHLHGNVVEDLSFIRGEGVVYVQMSKFSQIAVLSNEPLQTGEAELKLVERNDAPRGQAWFDIVLAGADTDTIKGFIAGEFTVTPADTTVPFDYEIVNADADTNKEIAITYNELDSKLNGKREYLLDVHAFNKDTSYTVVNATGTEITLAKLVVNDYGEGEIALSDVLFNRFDYDDSNENLREEINVVRATGAAYDIEIPTQKLTIEIDFNHATNTNNARDYQDMWIEIVTADKVEKIELGNDNGDVEYTTNKYVVEKTVLANTEYRVYVKGAGYRTAIYNLNMGGDDRTLKFWNNNKENANMMAIEYVDGFAVDARVFDNNFLAGDIVMDREIDIYDLSAVVSYFGERGIIGTNNDYVKYDLNRDGDINSIDVAILLTSWGK